MKTISIEAKPNKISIQISSLNNPATEAIDKALPVEATAQTWGDEIYFNIGVDAPSDGATLDLEVGDVAYWPQGKCFCIFFGRTPMSKSDKPMPASEVVVVGKITSFDVEALRNVVDGDKILVT